MRISHVIKTGQWRSDPLICSAPHFVVSRQNLVCNVVDISFGCQGQSCQAIKLFQITPYINDFHSTIPLPGSPYKRLEKLVFPIILSTQLVRP